jgi:hypothetical protein
MDSMCVVLAFLFQVCSRFSLVLQEEALPEYVLLLSKEPWCVCVQHHQQFVRKRASHDAPSRNGHGFALSLSLSLARARSLSRSLARSIALLALSLALLSLSHASF